MTLVDTIGPGRFALLNDALSGAPAQDDGRFRVPQILSED